MPEVILPQESPILTVAPSQEISEKAILTLMSRIQTLENAPEQAFSDECGVAVLDMFQARVMMTFAQPPLERLRQVRNAADSVLADRKSVV